MKKLNFYIVDNEYIEFLKNAEQEKRGFSRVPNMNYGINRKPKFLCGVVFEINNLNYYVPVSSFKQQKPDNFLIRDKNGDVTSSLRFNYMFPTPKELLTERRISTEQDQSYKILLSQELLFCRKNAEKIQKLAQKTYKNVCNGKKLGLIHNSCDFKLLENKCLDYQKRLEINKKIELHKQWLQSNGQAGEKLVLDSENLNGFKFYECDLRYAEIKNCDLSYCVFYADMTNTVFTNNKISGTKWIGSDIKDMKTDPVIKSSISQTLENNKIHDVMSEKLKKNKKNKEYSI